MNASFRSLLATVALAGIASAAVAQSAMPGHGPGMHPGAAMPHTQAMGNMPADAGSRQLHQSMMAGMQDMQRRPLTGDVDKDFIRMMRQHHLQGIEMARIQLQRGDDAEAKRMAQKILEEQQQDIARFDGWLQRRE